METHPSGRIAEGDLVIIYEDFKHLHAVRVKPPQSFSSRFGTFPHADMVGRRFGERLHSAPNDWGGGFVYLLAPTAELWTATLAHRTQILYIADISMIVLQLEVQPGCVVLEAGTGSGSLSHALARAIGPRGELHTFEFNAQRAKLAAAEFAANFPQQRVRCRHGDVCAENWSYDEFLSPGSVDAAIFDLPQPWDAVRIAGPLIRPGGRLCTFSPCIEQVARTLDALREAGFTGVEVIEAIVRTHEVKRPPSEHDAIGSAVAQATELALARAGATPAEAKPPSTPSGAVELPAPEVENACTAVDDKLGVPSKRQHHEADAAIAPTTSPLAKRPRRGDQQLGTQPAMSEAMLPGVPKPSATAAVTQLRTRPYADMRGHTGFLVFCTKHTR